MEVRSKLAIFFEPPFWVGVFENFSDGCYEVCKVTFGSEPKDSEVYEFIIFNLSRLNFSKSPGCEPINIEKLNPKRLRREISKEIESSGPGTKAQKALKLEYESRKLQNRKISRLKREVEKEEQFLLRQQKKKEKHKGH